MHEIQVLIGSDAATSAVLATWSAAFRRRLTLHLFIVPLDDALVRQMTSAEFLFPDLEDGPSVDGLAEALAPIVNALVGIHLADKVGLVFTQYQGGGGTQAALLVDAKAARARPSLGSGSINGVLAQLGVREVPGGRDEFDVVGLQRWRSNDQLRSLPSADAVSWFECDELSSAMQEFLTAVRDRALRWSDADPLHSQVYVLDDRIVLGLDVSDVQRQLVLRTLRVDYGEFGTCYGEDRTGQFVGLLDADCKEYGTAEHAACDPAELADRAATWLRQQMTRPLELREWRSGSNWARRYFLADTGRALCWSANDNQLLENGPPSSVCLVRTSRLG